jgi:hypothetical protein
MEGELDELKEGRTLCLSPSRVSLQGIIASEVSLLVALLRLILFIVLFLLKFINIYKAFLITIISCPNNGSKLVMGGTRLAYLLKGVQLESEIILTSD